MKEITLVVTSCGRHDLLERTLRSFCQFNTYPIKETVIVEDGPLPAPSWLWKLTSLGPRTWIANGPRMGQIYSVDRAYAEVNTEYIFHCEDDWEFFRAGFIEESLDILHDWPSVLQVWMRDDSEHPVVKDHTYPFSYMKPEWRKERGEGWSGFAFNPGLRRLCDYERIGSYGRHVSYDRKFCGELHLSRLYWDLGFVCAKIPAACKHIGGGNRHVSWATAPKNSRVLIAVPACHRYAYGQHKDSRIGHADRLSNDRVEAIRDTWAKDVKPFKAYVELKFFYGRQDPKADQREPLADEVFLSVPDDYDSLPHKVKAIIEHAYRGGYDYLYKGDDDTFVYVDRLMASGFEGNDYLGYSYPAQGNYISGGPGYWLSRKSMQLLSGTPVQGWAEDKWVGETLRARGIFPVRDCRYLPGFSPHWVNLPKLPARHAYISFHAVKPEDMKELHAKNPRPSFKFLTEAMGENALYREVSKCAFNIKPKESVSVMHGAEPTAIAPRSSDACTGGVGDPRRPQAVL